MEAGGCGLISHGLDFLDHQSIFLSSKDAKSALSELIISGDF